MGEILPFDIRGKWEKVKLLDFSNSREILLVQHKITSMKAVAKIKYLSKINDPAKMGEKEARILTSLHHDNILRCIGSDERADNFTLLLEYAPLGALNKMLKRGYGVGMKLAHCYFRQLILGLDYIHSQGYVHRDIKPHNMLLMENGIIRICDFEAATRYEANVLLTETCGTLAYMAPEMTKARQGYQAEPIDVWSAGVTLAVLLSGCRPWKKPYITDESFKKWVDGQIDSSPWKYMDSRVMSLLLLMLDIDASKRSTLKEVQQHEWFLHGEKAAQLTSVEMGKCLPFNIDGKWKKEKMLCSGDFGEILLVKQLTTPKQAVAKLIDLSRVKKPETTQEREVGILALMDHVNVLRYIGVDQFANTLVLLTEHAPLGDVYKILRKSQGIGMVLAHSYFCQLIFGLEYMHGRGFVHRDIKPHNMLLMENGTVKICDFGSATRFEVDQLLKETCGTMAYMPPEMTKAKQGYQAPPIDVWSAGVTLAVMLNGARPWKKPYVTDTNFKMWIDGERNCSPWQTMNPRVMSLLELILEKDVSKRITVKEIQEHVWFRNSQTGSGTPTPITEKTLPFNICGKWENVKHLGSGGFGEVLLVEHLSSSTQAAAKIMDVSKISKPDKVLEREVGILDLMEHVNIVKCIGVDQCDNTLVLLLEYAPFGSVGQLLKDGKGVGMLLARSYFRQVIFGLDFIHSRGFVHRDIKPDNLLLVENGIIKICDFGMAVRYEPGKLLREGGGTQAYMPPEMTKPKQGYEAQPVDVWSAGLTLATMISGRRPWNIPYVIDVNFKMWIEGQRNIVPWTNMDDKVMSLFHAMLMKDASKRITLRDVKTHEWFKFGLLKRKSLKSIGRSSTDPNFLLNKTGLPDKDEARTLFSSFEDESRVRYQ